LELHLGLESVVQELGVLSSPRVVDEIIRSHDRSNSSLNGTEERVVVDLTLGSSIDVRRVLILSIERKEKKKVKISRGSFHRCRLSLFHRGELFK